MNRFSSCVSFFAVSASMFVASSCAHHRDVRPGVNGQSRVVTTAETAEGSERDALSQANHYCKEFKKMPKILSEKTQYTGEMDENTRKTLRKASTAAILVGGGMDNDKSNNGAVIGGAGQVGAIMTSGEDYRTEMSFECH